MSNIRTLLATLCVLSAVRYTIGLTLEETALFKSHSQVIPNSDVNGHVTVGGTTNDSRQVLVSDGIPDYRVVDNTEYRVLEQYFMIIFDENPTFNSQPTCLPSKSIIGFATNGVAIFSPFDDNGTDINSDIGENECQGQTNMEGLYFYAQIPDRCSTYQPNSQQRDPNEIYGVALDGFPIYGPGTGSTKITNAELDACHGKTVDGRYRYYMTNEWPYVLGCFRGTPVAIQASEGDPYMTPPTSVCKFACNNKDAKKSDDAICEDDFLTTTIPDTQPTGKFVGLTEMETKAFKSNAPLDENLSGFVTINTTNSDTLTFSSNSIPDHRAEIPSNNNSSYTFMAQDFQLTIRREPIIVTEPLCLPSPGIIGFATNGVVIFSPYDSEGNDININGSFDSCQGRTSNSGIYHYTQLSKCVYNRSESSRVFGVALDGFPIYGPSSPDETQISNEDLDICHGRIVDGQYRYYVTSEFPYILGCFRGAPQEIQNGGTKMLQTSDCRYACNINEDTSSMDRSVCDNTATNNNMWLYIIIIASGGVAFLIFLVLCIVCCVKCRKQKEGTNNCTSCESEDEEYDYHL